jgi:plasmid stabilization system protein ParE
MTNNGLRLTWSSAAQDDLDRIVAYLLDLNAAVAEELVQELIVAGDSLGTFPYRGRKGRVRTTREMVAVYPYVMIDEVRPDTVTNLRIWHAAQDRR